jgi:hypothetical protein
MLIADTIPGFTDFNQRLQHPGGLMEVAERAGSPYKKGQLRQPTPLDLLLPQVRNSGQTPDLILQTLRSHDQYNTTIYGLLMTTVMSKAMSGVVR